MFCQKNPSRFFGMQHLWKLNTGGEWAISIPMYELIPFSPGDKFSWCLALDWQYLEYVNKYRFRPWTYMSLFLLVLQSLRLRRGWIMGCLRHPSYGHHFEAALSAPWTFCSFNIFLELKFMEKSCSLDLNLTGVWLISSMGAKYIPVYFCIENFPHNVKKS